MALDPVSVPYEQEKRILTYVQEIITSILHFMLLRLHASLSPYHR